MTASSWWIDEFKITASVSLRVWGGDFSAAKEGDKSQPERTVAASRAGEQM
jgi:hypothetical protein